MNNYLQHSVSQTLKALLLMLVGFMIAVPALAQSIKNIDFQHLKASDLSNQQLRTFWNRAQDQGYTLQQLKKMAVARGMNSSQAQKLVSRVRNLPNKGTNENNAQKQGTLRQVYKDSLVNRHKRSLSEASKSSQPKSRIFGSSLFRNNNISFAPSLNIPTPENYVLGTGDQLVIDIWGATDQNYKLRISTEGNVNLPRVGPVHLNGLTIKEARGRLKEELQKIYSSLKSDSNGQQKSHLSISLGDIRSIHVTVAGNARVPGSYTLPSLATAFNALYVAGGPDSLGTYRNIQIIRNGKVISTLDVYNYLVNGLPIKHVRLQDQDIIKIGPYESHVKLSGRTKRNGIFELKKNETFQNLLQYAGGFGEKAYTKRIPLVRQTATEFSVKDIKYPQQKDFKLENGDSLHVGEILQRFTNRVQIQGAVYRTGTYELEDTTSIYSLIERADGLRKDAFLNRGLIYRERGDLTTQTIPFSPRKVLNDPAKWDIGLRKNDVVVINSVLDLQDKYSIRVGGAVQKPGTFPFAHNMTLKDAILQSNGFKQSAAPYRIQVFRRLNSADTSARVPDKIANTYQFSVDKSLKLSDKGRGFTLQPYDQIFVRSSPAYYPQQNVTIKGKVLYPGKYALDQQEERISDLIKQAGGLTRFAYPKGANLTRLNKQRVDTSYLNVGDTLRGNAKLTKKKIKVGINLEKIMQKPGSRYDLILQKGDVLSIPKKLQTVMVSGEVLQPVGIRYQKRKSFKEYIREAGGPTNQGKKKAAYIVYANGSVDRASHFLFFRNYPDVKPGATIFVPRKKPNKKLSPQTKVGILSTLVTTLAIVVNVLR